MASKYPVWNDNEIDLLAKIAWNSAELADAEAGDVASIIAGSGISVDSPTGVVTITNTGVTSIAGTANEITASAATGAVTLSLPNALTFTGKTVTGGTFSGVALTGSSTVNGNTFTTGTGILTIAAAKTLTVSNTLTFTGTDGSSVNFGTGGTVLYSGGSYVSSIAGTANQITASAATGAVTLSIPATFIAPGSIAATSTVLGPTGVTATAGGFTATNTGTGLNLHGGGTLTGASGAVSVGLAGAVKLTLTNATDNATFRIEQTAASAGFSPTFQLRKANNTANARIVDWQFADGGVFDMRFLNDAENAAVSFATVTGTSASITSLLLKTGAGTTGLTISSAQLVTVANAITVPTLLNLTSVAGTTAGGAIFGADTNLFRSGAGVLRASISSGAMQLNVRSNATADYAVTTVGINDGTQNTAKLWGNGTSNPGTRNGVSMANFVRLSAEGSNNAGMMLDVENDAGMYFGTNGNLRLVIASDGLLKLAGTTSSFPALKRVTTEVEVRLGDDSAYTYLKAKLRASNGTAGANFSGVPLSITVVDGVVTAVA